MTPEQARTLVSTNKLKRPIAVFSAPVSGGISWLATLYRGSQVQQLKHRTTRIPHFLMYEDDPVGMEQLALDLLINPHLQDLKGYRFYGEAAELKHAYKWTI